MSVFQSERLTELTVTYGMHLLLALAVLFVGLWLSGWLSRRVDAHMERLNMEVALRSFLRSLISLALKVLVVISVASMLGVTTTSFIAVLGAAGLAVGLALQGSLSNFAGGVLLILFNLETAVGRARMGCAGVRGQGATALLATASKEEQRRQRAPAQLSRVCRVFTR